MPSKTTTTTTTDNHGLPPGAMFTPEQVCDLLNVTPRQLKRWRLHKPPVLPAFHPHGKQGPCYYKRADLIEFLTREATA